MSGVKQLDATPQKVLQEDGTTWQAPPRGLGLGPSPPHGCASGTLQCSLNEQAPGPNHAPANCMLAPIEYTHVPAVATSHTTHRPGASRKTMRRHTRTTGLSYTHTQGTNYFLTSHKVRSALNVRRMRRHNQIAAVHRQGRHPTASAVSVSGHARVGARPGHAPTPVARQAGGTRPRRSAPTARRGAQAVSSRGDVCQVA